MNIPKTAKKIKDSKDYIDIDGSVYTIDTKNRHKPNVIKKAQRLVHGYSYCGIYSLSEKRPIQRRVHRLVAEAFIPNPDNLSIVGHKNNIKSDNRVENLYWTTISENTKKAYDDGLVKNDKGFNDSQSLPVKMYDTFTNEELAIYGSASEAMRETGIPKNTILRQAKYKRPVRKPYYFRFLDDEDCLLNQELIGIYDYDTDVLIKTFTNKSCAAKQTNTPQSTVKYQCKKGKPKNKFNSFYFGIVSSNKCESTIES